ncbi:MAG: hypothetical protein JNM57_02450 [Cyclobacteriaceae bacterium]|nr:hypothetical protein [Cyclobacteriaceae bacterium]
MRTSTNRLNLILFILLLSACGKSLPELDGVDKQAWINDKNACNGTRTAMLDTLRFQKEKLLALSEIQVVELLGRPDQNELSKRNQKFYYYFIQPAKDCSTPKPEALRLVIRFNAIGLAKEITVE